MHLIVLYQVVTKLIQSFVLHKWFIGLLIQEQDFKPCLNVSGKSRLLLLGINSTNKQHKQSLFGLREQFRKIRELY